MGVKRVKIKDSTFGIIKTDLVKKDPTFGVLEFDTFVIRCADCKKPLAIYGGNPKNDDDTTFCIKHAKQRGFIK